MSDGILIEEQYCRRFFLSTQTHKLGLGTGSTVRSTVRFTLFPSRHCCPVVLFSGSVTNSLANIHSYILRDCHQTSWAGEQSAEVSMIQVSINERKKEQIKHKQIKVPNLPYSKLMLLEQIRSDPTNRFWLRETIC